MIYLLNIAIIWEESGYHYNYHWGTELGISIGIRFSYLGDVITFAF